MDEGEEMKSKFEDRNAVVTVADVLTAADKRILGNGPFRVIKYESSGYKYKFRKEVYLNELLSKWVRKPGNYKPWYQKFVLTDVNTNNKRSISTLGLKEMEND